MVSAGLAVDGAVITLACVTAARSSSNAFLKRLSGCFLVVEGPDGSGKSTQQKRLAVALRGAGLVVREAPDPGGTPVGDKIREILLDPIHAEMCVRTEAMLYMASRAQLVDQVIRPALARGEVVLGDRFVPSTVAYQGAAGGLSAEEIELLARVACGATLPDLVLVFDVDEQTAAKRLNPLLDRMEAKGAEFHRRVRASYLAQAEGNPGRFAVVDARGGPDEVERNVHESLRRWVDARPAR